VKITYTTKRDVTAPGYDPAINARCPRRLVLDAEQLRGHDKRLNQTAQHV
jgi:hypothetical protein